MPFHRIVCHAHVRVGMVSREKHVYEDVNMAHIIKRYHYHKSDPIDVMNSASLTD